MPGNKTYNIPKIFTKEIFTANVLEAMIYEYIKDSIL